MKLNYYLLAVAASALLMGCDRHEETVDNTHVVVTGQDVKDNYRAALESTKDYSIQSKDEFVAAMNRRMSDLDGKIDELRTKSAGYKDDAKVKSDKALDSLKDQRDALGRQYDKLKDSSADAWQSTKDGFAKAWDKVQDSYYDTKAKFQ